MKRKKMKLGPKLVLNKEMISGLNYVQQVNIIGGSSQVQVNCGTVPPADSCGAICTPHDKTFTCGGNTNLPNLTCSPNQCNLTALSCQIGAGCASTNAQCDPGAFSIWVCQQ